MLRSDRAGASSSGVAPTVSVGRSQMQLGELPVAEDVAEVLAERVACLALDLVDAVDQVLERAELHDPLGRGLLADAGDGGQVVARVAAQRGEVRVLGRGQPVLLHQGGRVVALHVGHAAAVVEHGHVVVDELEGVAVAGDDEDVVARRAGLRGEGGDDVVGLVAGGGQVADAERVKNLEDEADLAAELVRGLRPAGLVLDVLLVPEGRLGPVERHRHPGRLLVPQDVDEHRGEAVDGVGGLARRGREVLHREREERPVRQRVPVEQQEPVSHIPDPMTARRCPAALCGSPGTMALGLNLTVGRECEDCRRIDGGAGGERGGREGRLVGRVRVVLGLERVPGALAGRSTRSARARWPGPRRARPG